MKPKKISDLKKTDWVALFTDFKQNVGLPYKRFLDKITKLLHINVSFKKLSHKEQKSLSNLSLGWPKFYFNLKNKKDVLYRKFIRTEDLTKREW